MGIFTYLISTSIASDNKCMFRHQSNYIQNNKILGKCSFSKNKNCTVDLCDDKQQPNVYNKINLKPTNNANNNILQASTCQYNKTNNNITAEDILSYFQMKYMHHVITI